MRTASSGMVVITGPPNSICVEKQGRSPGWANFASFDRPVDPDSARR